VNGAPGAERARPGAPTAHLDDPSRLAERRLASSLATVAEVLRPATSLAGGTALLVRFDAAGAVLAAATAVGAPPPRFAPGDAAPLPLDPVAGEPVPTGGRPDARACVLAAAADGPAARDRCVVGPEAAGFRPGEPGGAGAAGAGAGRPARPGP
jgi:hypothetical protein